MKLPRPIRRVRESGGCMTVDAVRGARIFNEAREELASVNGGSEWHYAMAEAHIKAAREKRAREVLEHGK